MPPLDFPSFVRMKKKIERILEESSADSANETSKTNQPATNNSTNSTFGGKLTEGRKRKHNSHEGILNEDTTDLYDFQSSSLLRLS